MIDGKVFVTRQIGPKAIAILQREFAAVEVWPEEMPPSQQTLIEKAHGCLALVTTPVDRIDKRVFEAAPQLKIVSNVAVGFDNIDVAEATGWGVLVGNTPHVLSATTADLAFSLLLAVARRVVETAWYVRDGSWKTWHPLGNLGYDAHHKTLGIVGLGQIGLEVAKRGQSFDMEVIYSSRTRRPDLEEKFGLQLVPDLESLLGRADFVSLHIPLTPGTRHLIGKQQLQWMKPTAFLINTSRGAVVDQKALYDALKGGLIAGAALDVTDPEPIPTDDPLLTLPNVIITPHIGSASHETRANMAIMAVENAVAALKGKQMPSCVNPEVLQRNRA